GRPLQVIGGARRDLAEHHLLRGAPAHEHGDLVVELRPRHEIAILERQLHGEPERAEPPGIIQTLCTPSLDGKISAISACPLSWWATISFSRGLSMRFFFSSPASVRSIASFSSAGVTSVLPRRAASSAASLIKFARSAPTMPGVSEATLRRS